MLVPQSHRVVPWEVWAKAPVAPEGEELRPCSKDQGDATGQDAFLLRDLWPF